MTAIGRFSLAMTRPLDTAAGPIDRRDGYLIRVGSAPSGLGEATPLPGWTESLHACHEALGAADLPGSAADLPAMASTPAARHGLELALLDREARDRRVPLYRHLGGPRRVSTVPVNATVGDGSTRETAAAAADAVTHGFRTVKVKVGGRSLVEDLERLLAVREAVGGDIEVRADANAAWTAEDADEAIDQLDGAVDLLEQPLANEALDGHRDLRGRGVEIALDESVRDPGLEAVIEADAADVVVLKPMALGGVGRAMALGEAARERDLDVVVTTTVDAAVARAGAVHLAAALDVDRACGLATAGWLADDVAGDPAPAVDGGVSVPQGAGHGVRVEDLE